MKFDEMMEVAFCVFLVLSPFASHVLSHALVPFPFLVPFLYLAQSSLLIFCSGGDPSLYSVHVYVSDVVNVNLNELSFPKTHTIIFRNIFNLFLHYVSRLKNPNPKITATNFLNKKYFTKQASLNNKNVCQGNMKPLPWSLIYSAIEHNNLIFCFYHEMA